MRTLKRLLCRLGLHRPALSCYTDFYDEHTCKCGKTWKVPK